MKIKKIITVTLALTLFVPMALAESLSSSSYKIDMSTFDGGGTVSSSTSYQLNNTIVGTFGGGQASSSGFKLDTGLVNLELLCGNGILEFGEQCDDGNTTNGDGCSSICVTEAPAPTPTPPPSGGGGGGYPGTPNTGSQLCGNSIREGSEQCDDGNLLPGDGCSNICLIEGELPTEEPTPESPTAPVSEPEPEIPETIAIEEAPSDKSIIGPVRSLTIKTRPEKRVNAPSNWGVGSRLIFYNRTLKRTTLITNIDINKIGWSVVKSNKFPNGVYDIALKGRSHLTKVLRGKVIDENTRILDFTFDESFYLVAGDVHESKDDFINGLDISATVEQLYKPNIDADLNRDGTVNGLDLSIVLRNLYKHGERI